MESEEKKGKKSIKISIITAIILSIIFIVIILYFTIDPDTFKHLSPENLRYEFFALAVLFNTLGWFLWGLKLKILSNAMDKKVNIGLWKSTKIVIANLFLAGITPSMAGGEPVRIHLLNKEGMSLGCATASVLGERLVDAIFVLCVVPIALFIFKDRIEIQIINWGLTIGIIIFIVGIILFLYTIKNPEKTKAFLVFIDSKISKIFRKKKKAENKAIVKRIHREVDNFHNSMILCLGEKRKAFAKVGLVTIIYWSTVFTIPSMILLGLGLPPFFIESYAAQVLLLVIVMMPTTPGSSGVTEGGVAALYIVLIGSNLIGVFVLIFRFITYHINLIAGAIFQYRIFKSVASFSMDMIKKKDEDNSCSEKNY